MSAANGLVVNGLPMQLKGLENWTFITGRMMGQALPAMSDVTFFTDHGADSEGYYLMTGVLDGEVEIGDPYLAILSGAIPVWDFTFSGGSYGFTGIASKVQGAATALVKAVAISYAPSTETTMYYRGTLSTPGVYVAAEWLDNGNWCPGAYNPVSAWPHQVVISRDHATPRFYAAGKRDAPSGSTKWMSYKNASDDTTADWTEVTVPDASNDDGYIKCRVSAAGHIMAITEAGTLDASGTTNPTEMVTDSASGVRDIDYSYKTNSFYKVESGDIYVSIAGTGDWDLVAGPSAGAGSVAAWCACLDIPMRGPGSSYLHFTQSEAWLLVGHSDTGAFYARRIDTAGSTTWYEVKLSGVLRHLITGSHFPLNSHALKFVGDRLFVFTPRGVAISGPLGFNARKPASS